MTLQNVSYANIDLRVYRLARRILSTQNGGVAGECMTHGKNNFLGVVYVNNKAYLVCALCAVMHLSEAKTPRRNEEKANTDSDEIDDSYCEQKGCFNLSKGQKCIWCDRPICSFHSTVDNDQVIICVDCEDDLNRVEEGIA